MLRGLAFEDGLVAVEVDDLFFVVEVGQGLYPIPEGDAGEQGWGLVVVPAGVLADRGGVLLNIAFRVLSRVDNHGGEGSDQFVAGSVHYNQIRLPPPNSLLIKPFAAFFKIDK